MSTQAQLRGYLLEEALAWLLRNSGYRLLVHESQDRDELRQNGNGLCVKGRGAEHQVDVLGEFAFTPAFSLPIRLFLEAKFTVNRTQLSVIRNAHGVIHDINENFVVGPRQQLRKRFRYVYALFSAAGFSRDAQNYALAQQISLVDLSGASFTFLRDAVTEAAAELFQLQEEHGEGPFPVGRMRWKLRRMLGTLPDVPLDDEAAAGLSGNDGRLGAAAHPVFRRFIEALFAYLGSELLLGFPAVPFILPLVTNDVDSFLAYAEASPEHDIRLYRTGQGRTAEWAAIPDPEKWGHRRVQTYRLSFSLPERLETWISQAEVTRTSRMRAVKKELLSDIVIYRMVNDTLRTYQLKYHPGDLNRRHHSG